MPRRPIVGMKIRSGLGNQLFMYAAGLVMARRLDADFVCDVRSFRPGSRRPLGLDAFGLNYRTGRVPPYKLLREIAAQLYLVSDPFRYARRLHGVEAYDSRFFDIKGSCALSGYFQSWRYFTGHEDAIRAAFDVDKLATPATADIAAEIAASPLPVAVHVRRGDYVAAPGGIDNFAVLGRDYYDEARRLVEEKAGGVRPTFFLFSDEPETAMNELAGWPGLRPVTGLSALEDFYLMAKCRHFIIANSTFSWWTAWLGRAPDKQVVAPLRWFGPDYPHTDVPEDRLPPEWIVI